MQGVAPSESKLSAGSVLAFAAKAKRLVEADAHPDELEVEYRVGSSSDLNRRVLTALSGDEERVVRHSIWYFQGDVRVVVDRETSTVTAMETKTQVCRDFLGKLRGVPFWGVVARERAVARTPQTDAYRDACLQALGEKKAEGGGDGVAVPEDLVEEVGWADPAVPHDQAWWDAAMDTLRWKVVRHADGRAHLSCVPGLVAGRHLAFGDVWARVSAENAGRVPREAAKNSKAGSSGLPEPVHVRHLTRTIVPLEDGLRAEFSRVESAPGLSHHLEVEVEEPCASSLALPTKLLALLEHCARSGS